MTRNHKAALDWKVRGYNVVPRAAVDKKHPAVKWKELQTRAATDAELEKWKPKFENGFGFITGKISGVVVVETDGLMGETILDEFELEHGPLPETRVIRSGSKRGFHRHFRYPGTKVRTTANENIKIDIRGDGGFCVLPPSLHKSGSPYEIVCDAEPADLPDGLLEFIEKAAEASEAGISSGGAIGAGLRPAVIDGLGDNLSGCASMPPPVETMRAMLRFLAQKNYFEHRKGVVTDADGRIVKVGWTDAGMALKAAYSDEAGFELWGITHIDDQARRDAPTQWASFASVARPGQVSVGTLIKAAKDAGFQFALAAQAGSTASTAVDAERFTGQGADVWNGKKFAEMFRGKLLHIHETGDWLVFRPEAGWIAAPPGEAERAAKAVVVALRDEAADRWKANPADLTTKTLMKHVERASEARNIRAMIAMAISEPGLTVRLSEFDDDPMLLGVANGVLDLEKGVLLRASRDLLVSKRCNVAYDPLAKCPRFLQFMLEVQPDTDVRLFLRRLVGYCLTGRVDAHIFAFLYGHGANGKSVFIEVIGWLLGDYTHKIATETLMYHQRNPQGPSPDIVSLKGVRFAYANETQEGVRLDEARVKEMTGGDRLTGRVPYGKADICFDPTHKLILVGNHKPEIGDSLYGMWRRVALTPFDQTIPETNRDPKLLETLKREGPGILNWALRGLKDWRQNGLKIPGKITAATASYRDEQDVLGEWIAENCKTGPGYSERKSVLYDDYKNWAERNGHKPLAQGRLTRRLNERRYQLGPDKRTVHGLAVALLGNLP